VSRPSTASRLPPQRKTEILDAVQRVIIKVGFTDMTVGDIAREADVSTSLIHYHFASKAAVVTAALQAASDYDKSWRQEVADGPGPVLERLEAVLAGTLPEEEDDATWLLWIETWGETRRTPAIREVMADLSRHETDLLLRLVGDGVASGQLSCPDPAGAVARLCALRDGLAVQHTLFGEGRPPSAYADQLRAALHREVGLPAPMVSPLR
jgi:AcrR family transcriptional regulator